MAGKEEKKDNSQSEQKKQAPEAAEVLSEPKDTKDVKKTDKAEAAEATSKPKEKKKQAGKDNKEAPKDTPKEEVRVPVAERIGIWGEKLGMSQAFDPDGNVLPVSVVKIYTGTVIQIKTKKKEGYNALRVAFKEVKKEKLTKPLSGIFEKNKTAPHKILKEFRIDNIDDYKIGDKIMVEQFRKGCFVDVTGISKGKGFQGVIKKFNFKGGTKTRGQSNKWRAAGSIGAGADPGKVWKGRKMPGRMGGNGESIQNLKVVEVNKDKNLLMIKGSIPGPRNAFVKISHAVKKI